MKISELIAKLSKIQEVNGDLECDRYAFHGRSEVMPPRLAFRKILKGRESKPAFWSNHEPEDRKGEKVVQL